MRPINKTDARELRQAGLLARMLLVLGSTTMILSLVSCMIVCPADYRLVARSQIQNDINELSKAIGAYRKDIRSFPAGNEGLQALRAAPAHKAGWRGPYYPREIPKDPWGRPYIYRITHTATDVPKIGTFGADGKPGGKDLDEDTLADVVP